MNQTVNNLQLNTDALSREQKIELLRNYPPSARPAGVHPPVRSLGSGEILIRSHDPAPELGDYDPGDTTLPRGILNSGDPELLQVYREMYGNVIRALPDGNLYLEYLDQRIQGLNRVRQTKENSAKRTARGEVPALPPVQNQPNGAIILGGVTQTEFQSASQGCWSVAMSNLLGSRGVQISQKDIRSFRPTNSFGLTNSMRAYDTNEMNNDAGSDPFYDSELVMDNLPNTAVRQWGFDNLPPAFIDDRGNVYRDLTDDTAIEAIRKQVEYAIKHDHSPIALKYGGHYQTIVGIRENKVILKDSLPPPAYDERGNAIPRDPNTTYEVDLYDIVRKVRSLQPGYQRDISLIWLSELHKDPRTGEVEELKDIPNLRVDGKGNLGIAHAEDPNMLIAEQHADTECGKTVPYERAGLTPYFKTRFPKRIHKNLLKNATEPSRSFADHLNLPTVPPSQKTIDMQPVAKLPGYDTQQNLSRFMSEDEELNLAIIASLETQRKEQLAIEENIRLRQENKYGRISTGGTQTQRTAPVASKAAPVKPGKTKPVTQTLKPVKPVKQTAQTVKPVKQTAQTVKPVTQTTQPVKPVTQPVKPVTTQSDDTLSRSMSDMYEDEPRGINRLTERQREYLMYPEKLNDLVAIFDTKKHMRIVNWNSSEYNKARSALGDFVKQAAEFRRFAKENVDKPGFDEKIEKQIEVLKQKEEMLCIAMSVYVSKVTDGPKYTAGNKGVADMTQAAGAARLVGAKGLLDYIGGDNGFMKRLVGERNGVNYDIAQVEESVEQQFTRHEMEIIRREAKLMEKERPKQGYNKPDRLSVEQKIELLNRNYDRQNSERVKDTTFEALYTEKYKEVKGSKEKNAHRRAAAYAMDEAEKRAKEAGKAPTKK